MCELAAGNIAVSGGAAALDVVGKGLRGVGGVNGARNACERREGSGNHRQSGSEVFPRFEGVGELTDAVIGFEGDDPDISVSENSREGGIIETTMQGDVGLVSERSTRRFERTVDVEEVVRASTRDLGEKTRVKPRTKGSGKDDPPGVRRGGACVLKEAPMTSVGAVNDSGVIRCGDGVPQGGRGDANDIGALHQLPLQDGVCLWELPEGSGVVGHPEEGGGGVKGIKGEIGAVSLGEPENVDGFKVVLFEYPSDR